MVQSMSNMFFSELESQLRGEITSDTANFQTIIDLLYTKSQNFAIEYPLQKDDYFTIVYTIMRNLDSDLMKCDLDEVLSIDLNNHLVTKDIAYHWGIVIAMSDYYWNEYKNVLLDEAYLIDTLKYQQRVVNKQVEENNLDELSDILGLYNVKYSDIRLAVYPFDELPVFIKTLVSDLQKLCFLYI